MKIRAPSQSTQQKIKFFSACIAGLTVILVVKFKDSIVQFSQWGYLGIFLISAIGNATVFMPLPILVTIGAMGAPLNPFLVGLIASFGAAIGESVGYFLGLAGGVVLEKTNHFQNAKQIIAKYGVWGVFILASFPNPLFDIAGILAGATNISFPRFFIAAWAGTFLKFTLISVVGYQLLTG